MTTPTIRTKWVCTSKVPIAEGADTGIVNFSPVWESKPDVEGNACLENRNFGKWTPSGTLSMNLQNPVAFASYERGKSYYFDSVPAD